MSLPSVELVPFSPSSVASLSFTSFCPWMWRRREVDSVLGRWKQVFSPVLGPSEFWCLGPSEPPRAPTKARFLGLPSPHSVVGLGMCIFCDFLTHPFRLLLCRTFLKDRLYFGPWILPTVLFVVGCEGAWEAGNWGALMGSTLRAQASTSSQGCTWGLLPVVLGNGTEMKHI